MNPLDEAGDQDNFDLPDWFFNIYPGLRLKRNASAMNEICCSINRFYTDEARKEFEWRRQYIDYIRSDAWKRKRLVKMLRHAGLEESMEALSLEQNGHPKTTEFDCYRGRQQLRCEKCNRTANEQPLEVHHRHYRNLGNEPLEDLVVLCGFCHSVIHKVAKETGKTIEQVTEVFLEPQPVGRSAFGGFQ